MKMHALASSWLLLSATTLHAELPRPGLDCGCDRAGPYLRPRIAGVAWNALVSPKGTYQVEPFGDGRGLVIHKENDPVLNFGPASTPIGWGFGSDERGLVIHATSPGEPGVPARHFVWLYNLDAPARPPWQSQAPAAEAMSVFSPNGRYLLHLERDPNQGMHLWVVNVGALAEAWRHDYSAVARPGMPGTRYGLAMWGFSPDSEDASLAYLITEETGVRLNLVNLPRHRHVINAWRLDGSAELQFSPCGDVLSLVRYPAQAAEVWLERTLDGSHLVPGANVTAFGYLEVDAGFHVARTAAGTVRLAANTAVEACAEIPAEAPYWPAGAKLTATAIHATSLRLNRPTAQSAGGKILEYEFREEAPMPRLLGTLDPSATTFTAQDLAPETVYTFAVRARNAAELWTPEPLTLTVKTAPANAVPAWPLDAQLQADQLQDTSIHLQWPAALDDVAVTAYRVFQDGEGLTTLNAQARGHSVSNLITGRRYLFQVEAGDAQDQWSTDGPRLYIATEDRTAPTWPEGSRLYLKEREKHRLVLEWTPATDNVGLYLYRLSLVDRSAPHVFAMVSGTSTNAVLTCLLPGQSLECAVEAGDEAGNWSSGGPQARVSTLPGASECSNSLELASVNSDERPAAGVLALGWQDDGQYWGTADSESPALSADGRWVAFQSIATNLVASDHNSVYFRRLASGFDQLWGADIFVRDRSAGTTERISLREGGFETSAPGSHLAPDISADGRFVAFLSSATDLVPNDRNGVIDVFVCDRQRGEIRCLTHLGFGQQANGHCRAPQISANGSTVVFSSLADNLVSRDLNQVADVFAVDLATGEITRVSVASDGTPANQASWGAAISADGRFVAFASDASNLVPDDHNDTSDVFVHDRQTGQTSRVSVSSTGDEANGHSARVAGNPRGETRPALSADGRFVAFDSVAANLVADDRNRTRDVFVHDRQTRETTRVSLTSVGEEGPPPPLSPDPSWAVSWGPDIDGSGRFVVFISQAALVPEKRTIARDVFLHDRETGETRRLSACTCGGQADSDDGGSALVAISQDATAIAFDSESTHLKPGFVDPNWSQDVFVFTRDTGPPDQDRDGTPDADEQGPNGDDPLYDSNGDGVPDYLQDHITVRHTWGGQHYFRARVLNRPALARISPIAPPDPDHLPADVSLPFGVFSLHADGAVEPGGELLLELEFPQGIPFNSYYQYGGSPAGPQPQWYEFMYNGQTGAEIDGNRVILHFVDGARGDHDLLANGNLRAMGGPARVGALPAPNLVVEPAAAVLAEAQTETTVILRNRGGRPLVWRVIQPLPAWLTAEPQQGDLEPGTSATLHLRANRAGLAPGNVSHALSIASGGGPRRTNFELTVPFALAGDARFEGSCLVLQWRSEPGQAYRVQAADFLAAAAWCDISEVIVASRVSASWTDCRNQPAARFYRVTRVD